MARLEPKLALRRAPYSDELLSSWLLRTIKSYGSEPHTFCAIAFPGVEVWTRDIDRSASDDLLTTIDRLCAFPPGTAESMTLRDFERRIDGSDGHQGNFPWILSLGIEHRTRDRHGLMYCPDCWREDEDEAQPLYVRKSWRLGFMTKCLDHGNPMYDSCPHCDAPFVPHRSPGLKIWLCHHCGESLLDHPTVHPDIDNRMVLQMRDSLGDGYAYIGWGERRQELESQEFFDGLRYILSLIRTPEFKKALGAEFAEPLAVELNRVKGRSSQLAAMDFLMEDWPVRFVDFAKEHGITQRTTRLHRPAPAWVQRGIDLIDSGRASPKMRKPTLVDKLLALRVEGDADPASTKQRRAILMLQTLLPQAVPRELLESA